MKKSMLLIVLSLSLFLTACSDTVEDAPSSEKQSSQSAQEENDDITPTVAENESSSQSSSESTVSDPESSSQSTAGATHTTPRKERPTLDTTESSSPDLSYEMALAEVVGDDYMTGKALMRVDDQVILGEDCAVFKVGNNSEEIFVTVDWMAVSSNGTVYNYDIVKDEWSEYKPTSVIDYSQIDNCIYMLNDYLTDEFTAEYYDSPDEIKQAIFKKNSSDYNTPEQLLGFNEKVPNGYMTDPVCRVYYPVYNFDSFNSIIEHFSEYFTESAMEEIEMLVSYEFTEFEDKLYLVRGGRGYGAVTLDFDSVDYSRLEDDGVVIVDEFLFNEEYGKYKLDFSNEDGKWKIDSFEEILMYNCDMGNLSYLNAEVPDFMGFVSNNEELTSFDILLNIDGKMSVSYFGDYYDVLPEYVELLNMLGFETTIDGWEGFYRLEKYTADKGTLYVDAYFMNEEDGVVIEMM